MFPYCSSHEIAGIVFGEIDGGPPLFTLLQPEMPTAGARSGRPDQSRRVGIVKPSRGFLSPRFNVAGETIAVLEGATANIGMQERFDSYCKELFHSIQIGVHPSTACTFLALHQEHRGSRLSFLDPVEHLEIFVTPIFFSAKSFRRCRRCDF
jgi:hypothetical protein